MLRLEGLLEAPIEVPNDQVRKVTEKGGVLGGRGEDRMGRQRLAAVAHQAPQVLGHGLKPGADQGCLGRSGGGRSLAQDVVDFDGLLPAGGVDALKEEVGNDAALGDHEPPLVKLAL